jgi:hypothetical protein
MPFWSRLFGSTGPQTEPSGKAEVYKDFRITPMPAKDAGQFRVRAVIEKDGRRHEMIRADTMASEDEARAISLAKARQMIDEQGDNLFG